MNKKVAVNLGFKGEILVSPLDGWVSVRSEQGEIEVLEMTLSLLNSLDELGFTGEAFEKAKEEIYYKLGLY